ncbi:MAG TPA: BON domain-containing protein [Candidatus Binatia bacterium]
MKPQSISKLFRLGACCAVLALAGPAWAKTPADAWITTKAKLALMTSEGVSSNSVNVDTVDHQVTLHGTVASADEKQKAETAVRSIDGVSNVRDLLQVVPASRENAVQRTDAEISRQVSDALTSQPSLKSSSISVASVNNGVVLLKGNARSLTDHLTAVQTARGVPGVRRVASEVQSSDALADSQIWNESRYSASNEPPPAPAANEHRSLTGEAKDTARKTGREAEDIARDTGHAVAGAARTTADAATDLYATSMIKMRLLADRETPAMDINVDTTGGDVTLFGIVPSEQARHEAENEARKVAGVRSVKNELQVVADAKKPDVTAKDDQLESDVKQRLKARDDLKDVNADVKNCVVRLSGTVPSGEEKVEASQVARATRGVCSVQNDVRLHE